LRSGGKEFHRVSVANSHVVSPGQVVSADQLAKMKFSTLSIGGRFGQLLGKPYKPFYLMIYGNRFKGKSSVAMLLTDELVKDGLKALNSARDMYSNDSWLQKTFALFFLIAWCGLTALMLQYFIFQNIHLKDWQIAFVSSINGGISTKLSTIIDFLFGGAISGVNQVNLKRRRKNENI
jgi:hypothetical protein